MIVSWRVFWSVGVVVLALAVAGIYYVHLRRPCIPYPHITAHAMRRLALAVVLLTLAAITAFLPAVRDETRWRLARLRDTARAYSEYEDSSKAPRHREEASRLRGQRRFLKEPTPRIPESIFYAWMRWQGTPESYKEYLEVWPKGRFSEEFRRRLERILWKQAERENTVAAYQIYLDAFDSGLEAFLALRRQRALMQDDAPFQRAAARGSAEGWAAFLEEFRGHRRSGEALAAYARAQPGNLFDLVAARRITAAASGDEIFRLDLALHRLHSEDVDVFIPRGTYFRPSNPRMADMVATHEGDTKLNSDGFIGFSLHVVSASMRKRVASPRQGFSMQPASSNPDLQRLLAFFQFKMPTFRLRQAAVWVLTDNATWRDLKKNVSPQTGADFSVIEDEGREFDAGEAANTLMILEAAGIDYRRYALWRDRAEIFWQLAEQGEDERSWFERSDPDGLGRTWRALDRQMTGRVASAVAKLAPGLKRSQVEIELTASSPASRPAAAWLGVCLRDAGVDVEVHSEEDERAASVRFEEGLEAQAAAVAEILNTAFCSTLVDRTETELLLRPAGASASVVRKGVHKYEGSIRLEKEMHRLLRWGL
jgi:hypothetical protein